MKMYVAPDLEVFEVVVEAGFNASDVIPTPGGGGTGDWD